MVISLCHALEFNELRTAQVALVVTELATNLVKHTALAGGYLIFTPIVENGFIGLDILSLDQGPGITHIGECLRDGYSSTGTPGGGLGSIRRQSSLFDIYSSPGQGTAIFSRFWQHTSPDSSFLEVGAVCLPVDGEIACGDAWAMQANRENARFMLADGLGHGPDAAEAANQAVATFMQIATHRSDELALQIHNALRHTRGAAVAIAEIAFGLLNVRFTGIGNISGLIYTGTNSFNLVSYNGTAGMGVPKIKEFTYPWTNDSLLIMHSDGLSTHWSLADYPGLAQKHPTLIAGVLFRNHQRSRDDSCVLVAKSVERRNCA
jgi:anti-sigma regulatory factor (Ser/Thr protein kinase)/serine/threonine protein phosphatase PrpC